MYKIGDFSSLSKTTIKTLRYYEKEGLLLPTFIDQSTNYRYYETAQLVELSQIVAFRQIGVSVKDIQKILSNNNMREILEKKKREIENNLHLEHIQLFKINYLLKEKKMENRIIVKELSECIVYYKEGVIKNFGEMSTFIINSASECLALNPKMKCLEPDYCYVSYLDGEYKEEDIKIRYVQAVKEMGIENEVIKFTKLSSTKAACLYHQGAYHNLGESYSILMNYIKENNYEVVGNYRECYIDGCWNKDNVEDYLTEIQVPIKSK